ncbi:MAG: hypothetical protein QNJ17_12555 [Desulfocapsaceae bacterium]|nr:hypothetical protein [Desulfocapsaceae bacterium]
MSSVRHFYQKTAAFFFSMFLIFLVFISKGVASSVPQFSAVNLIGEEVKSDALIGQVTLLIITPSRNAEQATRNWVNALRREIDTSKYLIRDVIAVDLPFFISISAATEHAKQKVPKQYHDQTWLLDKPILEKAFNIPRDSPEACVVVLNSKGKAVEQIHGAVTEERLQRIVSSLRKLS